MRSNPLRSNPPPAAAPSMPDQLNQLADLHERGALTDDEFATAKARLLGGVSPEQAAGNARIDGDEHLATAALQIVSIIWAPPNS